VAPTAASVPLPLGPPGRPIFLHAGWRSRGTWLWDRLRAGPAVKAFYEPLHEDLAILTHTRIGYFRPDSWGSGHGESAPYFSEYAGLLGAGGRAVRLYQRRFAFDGFFMTPDQADPGLEAYIDQLLAVAQLEGRQPVLKFCRSLGRVAWMQDRYPDALHTVLLRDPASQFRSSRRQFEEDGNRYFLLAPFLILARNAANPLLAEAMRCLDAPAPATLGGNFSLGVTTTWRHVQRLSWAQRYRGFLAVWAATAVAAATSGADMIDADRLGSDANHRASVEAWFAGAGLAVDLHPTRPPESAGAWVGTTAEARDAAAAALAALGFVQAHQAALGARHARDLARTLTPKFTLPDGAGLHSLTRAALPPPAPARPAPLKLRQADAALYAALQAVLYPLRRAHYYLWRWLGWHPGPGVRQIGAGR
jgi:hypothetical protein